jgi:hypothetical protein
LNKDLDINARARHFSKALISGVIKAVIERGGQTNIFFTVVGTKLMNNWL